MNALLRDARFRRCYFVQLELGRFGRPTALARRPCQPLFADALRRIPIPRAVVSSPALHEALTSVRNAMWLARSQVHVSAVYPYTILRRTATGSRSPRRRHALKHRAYGAGSPAAGSRRGHVPYFWVGRALCKANCRATSALTDSCCERCGGEWERFARRGAAPCGMLELHV